MKKLTLPMLAIAMVLTAPSLAQTMPGAPPPPGGQTGEPMPEPIPEPMPDPSAPPKMPTPGEGDSEDMPMPGETPPGMDSPAPPPPAPPPPPAYAPTPPPPPPAEATTNPPLCSRTVRDNCINPREAPRGYRPGAPTGG